jgi:hypothetical protein
MSQVGRTRSRRNSEASLVIFAISIEVLFKER